MPQLLSRMVGGPCCENIGLGSRNTNWWLLRPTGYEGQKPYHDTQNHSHFYSEFIHTSTRTYCLLTYIFTSSKQKAPQEHFTFAKDNQEADYDSPPLFLGYMDEVGPSQMTLLGKP